jgi:hypothetical protein
MDRANFRNYRLGEFIAAILSEPERASYWAENCGWEAGAGYCSEAGGLEGCEQCLFSQLRDGAAGTIRDARQPRRRSQTRSL